MDITGCPSEGQPKEVNIQNHMRTKLFIYSAVLAAFTVGAAPADAKPKYHHNDHDDHRHYDRHDHDHDRYRHRSREVYFIERNRPVKRVVYINPGGGYYRIV